MKRCILVCVSLFFCFSLCAQRKGFNTLTPPEKRWVLFHPLIASRCYAMAQLAQAITDSLVVAGKLDTAKTGSNQDAFRHSCWMGLLVQKIPAKKAKHLGEVHEAGNYWTFKHRKTEGNLLPDSMASVMDLANNLTGIATGLKFKKEHPGKLQVNLLVTNILTDVENGKCLQLKKDIHGNFTDCSGSVLTNSLWKEKWNIPKCLEPSRKTKT